jgi:tRNA-dihydrouridine synthase 3
MGCPIDIVVNKGAGSSLLTKPMRIKSIVQAASTVTEKPLTIKVMQVQACIFLRMAKLM